MVASFCNDKQIGLELSQKNKDGYDLALKIAKLASKSQPVPTHGRSPSPGNGEMTLAHAGGNSSGLPQIIENMAAEFKARRN